MVPVGLLVHLLPRTTTNMWEARPRQDANRKASGVARSRKRTRRTTASAGRRRRFFNYPRSHVRSFRRWLPSWRVVVGTFLLGIGLTTGVVAAAYYTTGVPDELPGAKNQTTKVLWADGSVMTTFAVENREIIVFKDLPEYVGNAVVASEDRTFWTNQGVDPKGMARALVNNLKGNDRQGASTLTQQYVERYYTNTTTSYSGKFREAILALKITQEKDKETILGDYLNTIFFGRGAYGIEAASKVYFGKSAKDLTYSEAALLAGIIPSPTRYDPANNPDMANDRWTRTLNFMAEDGYITAAERKAAVFPEVKPYVKSDRMAGTTGYLIQMVRDELTDPKNNTGLTEEKLDTGGLTIKTTIDPKMQAAAVETMKSIPHEGKGAASPNLRSTLVSIDPDDGSIKALYGGADFLTDQYNTATKGAAQGGSTFKPFTLIGALESGIRLDQTFNGANNLRIGKWRVTNFDNGNFGQINLVRATQDSVNTVYAQLNQEIGPEKTADVAQRAGIVTQVGDNDANVLGTTTVHATELANAYATFAAQGYRSTPHIVAEVTDVDGLRYRANSPRVQVFKSDVMAGATYAMTQVVEKGSGKPARDLDRPAAGKTGTSNDNKSAWFAGYTPQLATVVGLYQSGPKGEQESITPFGEWARERSMTGGKWPVHAWTTYMKTALEGQPVEQFPAFKMPAPTYAPTTPSATPTTPTPSKTPQSPKPTVPVETTVVVPGDLAGQGQGDAVAALVALGLQAQVTEEFSADIPAGTVIRVLPSGAKVPKGTAVSVVVSKGPDPAGGP